MGISRRNVIKGTTFIVLLATLTACGLPRSGPNKSEIFKAVEDQAVDAYVVAVDEQVTRAFPEPPRSFFPSSFVGASPIAPNQIRAGDTLNFTIYENIDDGLFSRGGAGASISTIQVDDNGFIFLPYAGRIRAAGNTPERIREIITQRLSDSTPQPQVIVQRSAGDGGTVSVIGNGIGGQGSYALNRANLRLLGLLAAAGGVPGDPELVSVTIARGKHRASMRYNDILANTRYDVALRPGDRVIVERDDRTFTSLGATGAQAVVPFQKKNLSALEALAQVGGLREASADPTGIFIIRDEKAKIANSVMGRTDFTAPQRLIYLLNLTEPSGLFFARNFYIEDGDTIYVTEAPFRQWTKTLNAITGTANTARNLERVVSPD